MLFAKTTIWFLLCRRHCDLRESNLLLDVEAALEEFWVAVGLPWATVCWEVQEGLR